MPPPPPRLSEQEGGCVAVGPDGGSHRGGAVRRQRAERAEETRRPTRRLESQTCRKSKPRKRILVASFGRHWPSNIERKRAIYDVFLGVKTVVVRRFRAREGHTVNFLRLRRAKISPPPPHKGNMPNTRKKLAFFGAGKIAPRKVHYPSHLIVRTCVSVRTKGF